MSMKRKPIIPPPTLDLPQLCEHLPSANRKPGQHDRLLSRANRQENSG